MTYGTSLTAKGNVLAGISRTGNTSLCYDDIALTDMTVMTDMNEIIYLSALANNGLDFSEPFISAPWSSG